MEFGKPPFDITIKWRDLGKAALGFVWDAISTHQLSPISEHFQGHPFDELYTGEPTQEVAIVDRFVD